MHHFKYFESTTEFSIFWQYFLAILTWSESFMSVFDTSWHILKSLLRTWFIPFFESMSSQIRTLPVSPLSTIDSPISVRGQTTNHFLAKAISKLILVSAMRRPNQSFSSFRDPIFFLLQNPVGFIVQNPKVPSYHSFSANQDKGTNWASFDEVFHFRPIRIRVQTWAFFDEVFHFRPIRIRYKPEASFKEVFHFPPIRIRV